MSEDKLLQELMNRPKFQNPLLSPDGQKISYIVNNGNCYEILVEDFWKNTPKKIFTINNVIGQYYWINNDLLMVQVDQDGNERYSLMRISVNDLSVENVLFPSAKSIEIINYGRAFDHKIILSVEEESEFPNLYSYNIITREMELLIKNPSTFS